MVSISVDRSRISTHYKATVIVTSDTPFIAYEARGSHADEKYADCSEEKIRIKTADRVIMIFFFFRIFFTFIFNS